MASESEVVSVRKTSVNKKSESVIKRILIVFYSILEWDWIRGMEVVFDSLIFWAVLIV